MFLSNKLLVVTYFSLQISFQHTKSKIHSVSCNCSSSHLINISAPVLFHDDMNQGCKTISDAFRIKCHYIIANIYYPFLFIVYRSILPKQWANGYLMAIFLIYEGSLSIKCCISHAPISLYDVTK